MVCLKKEIYQPSDEEAPLRNQVSTRARYPRTNRGWTQSPPLPENIEILRTDQKSKYKNLVDDVRSWRPDRSFGFGKAFSGVRISILTFLIKQGSVDWSVHNGEANVCLDSVKLTRYADHLLPIFGSWIPCWRRFGNPAQTGPDNYWGDPHSTNCSFPLNSITLTLVSIYQSLLD